MRFIWMIALIFVMVACDRGEEHGSAITLATGVTLVGNAACDSQAKVGTLNVSKDGQGYIVAVSGYFPCDADLEPPYLHDAIEGKATLVFEPKYAKGGFHSSCECARSLTVRLSDRVGGGDTLYVLNGTEVMGHLILP